MYVNLNHHPNDDGTKILRRIFSSLIFHGKEGTRREFVTVFMITFGLLADLEAGATTNGNVMMKMMCGGRHMSQHDGTRSELKQTIIIYMHHINICFLFPFSVLLDFSVLCFSVISSGLWNGGRSVLHTITITTLAKQTNITAGCAAKAFCWCYVCGGGC